MLLAQKYHRLPSLLRGGLIERAVQLLPGSDGRRTLATRTKRFMRAVSMPNLERYMHWISVFDSQRQHELYSENFARETQAERASRFIEPWFANANGAGLLDATLLADTMTYLPNDCW